MTTKEFIKLFIPPIVLKPLDKIRNLNVEKCDVFSTISEFKKTSDTLCILGNGPSLNESIGKYEDFMKSNDCIVVNHFASSDYYKQIKPKIYCVVDPNCYVTLDTLTDYYKKSALILYENIVKKTEWDISFIAPGIYRDSWSIDELCKNSHINILYYNNVGLGKYKSEDEKFLLWNKNLLAPPAQTVLNTCLWFGICSHYKNIYLFGADTSWVENIRVDQNDNSICMEDTHFYSSPIIKLYTDTEGKIPSKLYEELDSISRALKNYWDLKEYADYNGVKVYNSSEYSLIDAFERRKPYV